MSQETRAAVERLKGGGPPPPGDGLADRLREAPGEMFGTAKSLFTHGRDELAAALFSQADAYVMYGWSREDVPEPAKQAEPAAPEVARTEPDRGIEM